MQENKEFRIIVWKRERQRERERERDQEGARTQVLMHYSRSDYILFRGCVVPAKKKKRKTQDVTLQKTERQARNEDRAPPEVT